ncbi:MAG: ATP-binding protein [Bryobacteraceae bacterium]
MEENEQRDARPRVMAITDSGGHVRQLWSTGSLALSPGIQDGKLLWESYLFGSGADSSISQLVRAAVSKTASSGFATFECPVSETTNPMRFELRAVDMAGTPMIFVEGFAMDDDFDTTDAATRLVYAASHDLQEPLRMILIHAQLLQKRLGATLDEDGNAVLNTVIDAARRMNDRVRSLLAYAQLELAEEHVPVPELSALSASEVLNATIRDLRVLIQEKGARIESARLPLVLANPSDLSIVFQNLVSNALKYHKPGLPPHVEIRVHEEGAHWRFTIQDNGLGFDPRLAHSLFKAFTRFHTERSGTGLGLAICKRAVERMGGRIWAEPLPDGEGAAFHFTLLRPPQTG